MRLVYVSILTTMLMSSVAFAQDEGAATTAVDPAAAAPAENNEAAAEAFPIRRGLYAEADLGVFLTMFGRNTNKLDLPSKPISNVQPYLGVTFGYDLLQQDKFSLGLGVRVGAGYSSGAGRVSDADIATYNAQELTTRPNDFAVYELGLAVATSYLVHERVALTLKVNGGVGAAYANPYLIAGTAGSAGTAIGGFGGGSLGVEYFTLLNDFSVGLDIRGAAVFLSGGLIPNLTITAPIKYTF